MRGETVPSGATVSTMRPDWSAMTAASGTISAGASPANRAQAGEAAGRQEEVRVRHHGAAADRAATGVEAAVDEIHAALAAELGLVQQAELHHRLGLAAPRRMPPCAARA